jgi:hypothetical protein
MSSALVFTEASSSSHRIHNAAVLSPRMGEEMAIVRSLQSWEHYGVASVLSSPEGTKLGDGENKTSLRTKAWLQMANELKNITYIHYYSGGSRLSYDQVVKFLRHTIKEQGIEDFTFTETIE